MSLLISGAAGFIGFHLCRRYLEEGVPIIGYDNVNNYYDQNLKRSRINILKQISKKKKVAFKLIEDDLENSNSLSYAFESKDSNGKDLLIEKPKKIIHLAAQAGVRNSLKNPDSYIQSNLVGFGNILENIRRNNINHFVFASSSSVYGGNRNLPFSENQTVDHPINLYAASKKANELMAHSYSHLFNIPTTGLRFFTVYGPWGRPDMALFIFTKAIIENKEIEIFNNGNMIRDFTYIDDIVESVYRIIDKPPNINNNFNKQKPNPSESWAPFKIFNVGNSSPTLLMDFIKEIEKALGKKAKKKFLPIQPGDVLATAANTSSLEDWIKYKPKTTIKEGVEKFVKWFLEFYN